MPIRSICLLKLYQNDLLNSIEIVHFLFGRQLCSDANKTATSSSHQDSEYDTASDSQSSDEADPLHKPEPPVSGDTGGGDSGGGGDGGGDKDASVNDITGLIDMVATKTSIMQLSDGIPIEEQRKIPHEDNDVHDDADGEADDDDER